MTGPQAARFAARAVRRNYFVFRRRGGLCGPFVSVGFCSWSLLGRAVALWGHAALVPGQFLVSGGAANFAGRSRPPDVFPVNPDLRGRPLGSCRVGLGTIFVFPKLRGLLGWLHCVRRTGQFLVFARFSVALVAPWPPRMRAIFVGGGGRRAAFTGAHVPSFLCSGGVRSPGEVGVLGHPGFWCRPRAGFALSPGSQGVSRQALHSLRGPGPASQTEKHYRHRYTKQAPPKCTHNKDFWHTVI